MRIRVVSLILLLVIAAARGASAQDRGATVGGGVATMSLNSETDLSFSGAFGFRFTRVVGLELEAGVTPDTSPRGPNAVLASLSNTPFVSSTIFPGFSFEEGEGRVVMFTSNVRVEIPTTAERLTPYFVAGGGVANVRQTTDFSYLVPVPLLPDSLIGLPNRPIAQHIVSTSTDLALTLGGGLGIKVAGHLFLDADLRVIRLMGESDRNAGRFGVGVRYRF